MFDQVGLELFSIDEGDGTEDRYFGVPLTMIILEAYPVLNQHQGWRRPAVVAYVKERREQSRVVNSVQQDFCT
jgi:hypothetical protein